MEQGNSIGNTENLTSSIFTNAGNVTENTGYQIRTDNNNNLSLEENERIRNKNTIQNGLRYHLTRNQGNLTVTQDSSVQVETPTVFNQLYAIRGQGNQFTLTRTPALTKYTFFTNSLQNNASFDILGERGSRCVHVCNASGLLVKIGVLHVTTFRSIGLIDRAYFFEIIHNNIDQQLFSVRPDNSVTTNDGRSATLDIEFLNIFVNQGDCLGVRYVQGTNGRTGDYCQVRLMVDANARQNNFGGTQIP